MSAASRSIYLCGHSLGLLPLAARDIVNEELDEWARLAVAGHEHARRPWVPYHENLTAGLAALTGALADEVVAMNSLTVNLHLMLASFYRPAGQAHAHPDRGGRILLRPPRGRLADRLARARPRERPHRAGASRGRGAAARGAYRSVPRAPRRGDRAGAVARGAVPHRPGLRSRAHRAGRAPPRLHRRIRPGAFGRQHCRWRCTGRMRTSPCGAATSTSTPARARSAAASCTSAIRRRSRARATAARCPARGSPAGGATRSRRAFSWSRSFAPPPAPPPGRSAIRRSWRRRR